MSRQYLYHEPPCKRKAKWKLILAVLILVTLFIEEANSHGIGKKHSKKTKPVTALVPYVGNQRRHHRSKLISDNTTMIARGSRRRRAKVEDTYQQLKNENRHRTKLIKGAFQPEFTETLANLSVVRGKDARFKCVVEHLGGYKVGWVKVDTKAIQAIHNHVVTLNRRIMVTHSDHATWYLHIKKVRESDRGLYMCQVNTDPMISQTAILEILHPPDFVEEETSSSIEVQEGSPVRLKCKAFGRPSPEVCWRRSENAMITIRGEDNSRVQVHQVDGEILYLPKVTRTDMDNYLCFATNGIPPTVRKTVHVGVSFHPMMQVPNQLVGAPLGTDVTLVCYSEAYPKAINYWVKDGKVWFKSSQDLDLTYIYKMGEIVAPDRKYEVDIKPMSDYEQNMTLKIRNLSDDDLGSYNCVCKNPVGEVVSQIRVYEINDDKPTYRENTGYRGNAVTDTAIKKPRKQVKLRQKNRGNSTTEKNINANATAKPPESNDGEQNYPHVYCFYFFFISFFYG